MGLFENIGKLVFAFTTIFLSFFLMIACILVASFRVSFEDILIEIN